MADTNNRTKAAVGSAVIGAVVGAGAAAAAIALSDQKNREKIKKTFSEARTKFDKISADGQKHLERATDGAKDVKKDVKKSANDALDKK